MALRYNFFPVSGILNSVTSVTHFSLGFPALKSLLSLFSAVVFGKMIFFFLFPNNRMYPQFLHNPMDPVLAIVRMVEMVYPTCHSPVA